MVEWFNLFLNGSMCFWMVQLGLAYCYCLSIVTITSIITITRIMNTVVGHYYYHHCATLFSSISSLWLEILQYYQCQSLNIWHHIRRPLPSLGPGGAAPGITAGVRLWPARTSACTVHQTPNPLPLPSQVTANTLPCSGSPLPALGHVAISPYPTPSICRGWQNLREARSIRTQDPSVGLYRFAAAFPSHREHVVALQRQPFASAWPCCHTPFRGFQSVCEARPITTQNPSVGLDRFAAPSQVTANTLPCSGSPLPAPG